VRLRPKRELTHRCVRCGAAYGHGYTPKCLCCAGLVDVVYDLDAATLYDSDVPLERYFDLLPILDPANLAPLGEGNTPCVHAATLGAMFGLDCVYLKVESANPTGTTKDRMASTVLSLFGELGIREFVSCSTGNSASSLAYGILRHPRFTMHLYVGGEFRDRLRFVDDSPNVVLHVLEGTSFADAYDHACEQARRCGATFEAGFFNPAPREGLKVAFLEAVEQVPREIEWYFQAVSSAMGVYGVWKGAGELRRMGRTTSVPRLVCVQQESCAPMARAWDDGCSSIQPRHVVREPRGIAAALLRGDPGACYPYVHDIVRESRGAIVSVTESEIRDARDLVTECEGVRCGYEAAATVAALRTMAASGVVGISDVVLLNLSG
jgi:threonine synthase